MAMACYYREGETRIYDLCCKTCDSFKDPDAQKGCKYGDMVPGCSEHKCTMPATEDTKRCCKTCRSSLETASTSTEATTTTSESTVNQAATTTQQSTTMSTTTAKPTANTATLMSTTTQQSTASASLTTTEPTTMSTTPRQSTMISSTTGEPLTMSTTTKAASTASTTPNAVASAVDTQTNNVGGADNTEDSVLCRVKPAAFSSLSFCQIDQVCRISFFKAICCTCSEIENPDKRCRDVDRRCRNIRDSQCYTQLVRERCCDRCQRIAQNRPERCRYGDRFPKWCKARFNLSPQHTCATLDDLCCATCTNVPVVTRRVVIGLPKALKSWFKNSRKQRKGSRKSKKHSRRGGRGRSKGRRGRRRG